MQLSQAFLLLVAAADAAPAASSSPVFLPLFYAFGNYPKIATNVLWGTPEQKTAIDTVVDLGSANFWVYGPKAILNYGNTNLGGVGPCNQTVHPFYNNTASTTATPPLKNTRQYVYGGNSKFISAYYSVNDTMHFSNAPSLANQRVEVSNFTTLRQAASKNCPPLGPHTYDHSILGLSPYVKGAPPAGTEGPSFRQDLLSNGLIKSPTLSMWFDRPPANASGEYTFRGTALFGALPKGKHAGPLVLVKPDPPKGVYVGYYVARPAFSANSPHHPSTFTRLPVVPKTPRCLIDSGSGQDYLPLRQKDFVRAAGLIVQNATPTYNGTCDDIPRDAALAFTFAGVGGRNVTVRVPLRNYARDTQRVRGKCELSMALGTPTECVLGAPFVSGAFLAFDDDKNQIAIAQGLASSGATEGVKGLGPVEVVKAGQGLPAS